MLAIRGFFNKVSDCVRPNTREAADVMHGGERGCHCASHMFWWDVSYECKLEGEKNFRNSVSGRQFREYSRITERFVIHGNALGVSVKFGGQ
jgi:hypothetical protein